MSVGRCGRALRCALAALLPLSLGACIGLTALPRAVVIDNERNIAVRTLPCSSVVSGVPATLADTHAALDPKAIRVVTWNLHKQDDAGWERDLTAFVAGSDLVLLQEATLSAPLRNILDDAGLRWVMASSFIYGDVDIGVLTATRATPVASCTERAMEPLLRIPKSAVISWFALAGTTTRLAVVNIHAINFSLLLGAYHAQFAAIAQALASHSGPIVFAGDFNTWTDARVESVRETADALGLREIPFEKDQRTIFLGHQLDHMMVRGLDVVEAAAIPVKSSDHNPVRVTLKLADTPR